MYSPLHIADLIDRHDEGFIKIGNQIFPTHKENKAQTAIQVAQLMSEGFQPEFVFRWSEDAELTTNAWRRAAPDSKRGFVDISEPFTAENNPSKGEFWPCEGVLLMGSALSYKIHGEGFEPETDVGWLETLIEGQANRYYWYNAHSDNHPGEISLD